MLLHEEVQKMRAEQTKGKLTYQLQQQARFFATEAVAGDFITFQVPGDVNISYVLGKVDSGLAAVLEHTTNTMGGNFQRGTEVLCFKQMRAVQPGSLVFSLVDGPAYPVDIRDNIGARVALQPIDARLRAGAAVRYTGCSPKNNKES